jgi:hypothetical protein
MFGDQLHPLLDQGRRTSFASTLKVQRSASLSRPVSSPAFITTCRCPFSFRLVTQHGALASLRGRHKPPHDGMRRMGRYNLSGVLAADRRQDRRTLRTHPTRRPREDIFLPEQNALSPCLQYSGVLHRWFRQPRERRRCPSSSGNRCHRPTSGAEPRPDAWRLRRSLDASRAAEPSGCPTPSTTTISRCE